MILLSEIQSIFIFISRKFERNTMDYLLMFYESMELKRVRIFIFKTSTFFPLIEK